MFKLADLSSSSELVRSAPDSPAAAAFALLVAANAWRLSSLRVLDGLGHGLCRGRAVFTEVRLVRAVSCCRYSAENVRYLVRRSVFEDNAVTPGQHDGRRRDAIRGSGDAVVRAPVTPWRRLVRGPPVSHHLDPL